MPVSLGEVACLKKTAKAVLVELLDKSQHWIPISVIDGDVPEEGQVLELEVRSWFADKEGLG